MKHYVIADPHGFLDATRRALADAGFFEETLPHRLVVCGDVLDRGKDALALTEFLLAVKERGELIYVQGNHEDLLMQCMQEVARGNVDDIACGLSHHYTNGTWDTLLQLGEMTEEQAVSSPYELIRRVRNSRFYQELLPKAVEYYETKNYIFCHGWIPAQVKDGMMGRRYKYMPDWRTRATVEDFKRSRWLNGISLACEHGVREEGKTVVCGHFHTSYGHARIRKTSTEWGEDACFSPFYDEGIIALDACTAHSGFVNCIVIEDDTL